MTRLAEFLEVDDKERDRTAGISSLSGFIGFIVARTLGFDGATSAYIVFGIMAIVYFLRIWLYARSKLELPQMAAPKLSVPRRFLMALPTSAMLVLIATIRPPRVEAAILDRRLRALARGQFLSADEAQDLADGVSVAVQHDVALSETTLIRVRDTIRTSIIRQPGSEAIQSAAHELLKYSDEFYRRSPETPAKLELEIAKQHFLRARRLTGYKKLDLAEANAAISALNRAIELTGDDKTLRGTALLRRAMLYDLLEKHDDALTDADAAYRLGVTDLATIISVEASALLGRGADTNNQDDLKQAAALFTAAIVLGPPRWATSSGVEAATVFLSQQYLQLGETYSHLKDFARAVDDLRHALSIGVYPPDLATAYLLLILSELHLGSVSEGLNAAIEWEKKTADPEAIRVHRILEENLSNPEQALLALSSRP